MEGAIREALLGHGYRAPWAHFDSKWYRKTYPMACDVPDALDFYLSQGAALGHSPNIFFDESWYVLAHPKVRKAIEEGHIASGFDHYLRSGRDEYPAHWLFDPGYYRDKNADLTDTVLERNGFANLYDHYLRAGAREGRAAHVCFSASYYRRQVADSAGYVLPDDANPFEHYLNWIENEAAEISTSIYFDPEWYGLHYPDVKADIQLRKYNSALHHYLSNDTPSAFNPLEYFQEQFYFERYQDLENVIGLGRWFRNGYVHFVRYGQFELRNPTPYINLQYYWARRSNAMVDAELAHIRDPFEHLLTIGLLKGLPFAPTGNPVDVPEKQSRALFLAHAENTVPLCARRPLDFTYRGQGEVSVLVVIHNHLAMTLLALASLRANYAGDVQLILIDSGSTDEARFINRYIKGAVHIRFENNVGFVHACNTGLLRATAPRLLFLNNDVQLSPGTIEAAIGRLDSDPTIGAVGAKVIRTNEKLQEAGCIVWRDGKTTGYMRDWSPLCPEANFVRDVDFASGVFLFARTDLVKELGGFDTQFAPAYFEDADLCLQIWEHGKRVVYDPNVVVYHYEYGSSRESGAAFAMMHRNERHFYSKHFQKLKRHFKDLPEVSAEARFAGPVRPRILYVEDFVPLRGLGAGAVRSNDIIRIMAEQGYQVTVYPVHGTTAPLAEIYADFPDTVEIMHDVTYHDMRTFFADRRDYFDCVWICRAHNLNLLKPILEQANLDPKKTTLILDTEAVFSIREALQAKREGKPFDLKKSLEREFEHAHFCQEVITVSPSEATALRKFGISHARVIGTYRPVTLTPRLFSEREGLLFVGSLYADNTPNYDSLAWFTEEVLPLVEAELGWETRLNIVGHCAPDVSLGRFLGNSRVTWHGPVPDLEDVYNTHRVVIAPTRFAAGTPYKVYEAASYGVPAVITDLLATQLGWNDGVEMLAAPVDEAEAFAQQIVRLYRSESLWTSLREAAAARLRAEQSREKYIDALSEILPPILGQASVTPKRAAAS